MKILQENNTKILKLKLILYYSYLWQRAKYLSYVKLFFKNKRGQKLEKIILIKYLTFYTSFFYFLLTLKWLQNNTFQLQYTVEDQKRGL